MVQINGHFGLCSDCSMYRVGFRFAKNTTKQLLPDQLSAAAAKLDECPMLPFQHEHGSNT